MNRLPVFMTPEKTAPAPLVLPIRRKRLYFLRPMPSARRAGD
jgi:hypothetical protein